uniref:BED-type domain-containing protein n=1 Tax=Fagus sylvatica TaxID=28930 RepID=A0A2N9ET01_FAGSY
MSQVGVGKKPRNPTRPTNPAEPFVRPGAASSRLTSSPHGLTSQPHGLALTSWPHLPLSLSLDSVPLLSLSPSLTPPPQSSISHRRSSQAVDISLTKSQTLRSEHPAGTKVTESVDAGATPVDVGATLVEAGVSQPEFACTQQAGSTPVKPSLPPTGKKPTGRKVSPAWDHFDKVDYLDGRRVAICKYCKRELSAASKNHGTSSLLSHAAVDNASSNGGTIKFLETVTKDWKGTILEHQFLHMRCCAHILNLIVGEGLKERDSSISKVRDAVRYVKSSPNRFQIFKDYVKTLGIESKSLLCLDIATRWNSTYIMLESAVKFEKASGKIANVRDVLTKLFDYYASVHSPNVEVESVSEKSTMTTDVDMSETNPYAFMDSQYDLYLEVEQSMGCNNELDKYLAENCEGRKDVNFDVLLWWKINSSRYQVLSKMAQDVLAVPVSTVAFESAFSTGGHILEPFRSSLSPDMVQVLVCSQNWLKSSVPISLRNAMDEVELLQEEYDFAFVESETSGTSSVGSSSSV